MKPKTSRKPCRAGFIIGENINPKIYYVMKIVLINYLKGME